MKNRFFLSTIACDAWEEAEKFGLPLEIAEFCDTAKLDISFPETDAALQGRLACCTCAALHAPFSELFPCAVDPKIRQVAWDRFTRAMELARHYGAKKLIIHAGFNPHLYFPCWFREKSAAFWRDFLKQVPNGLTICLENVLEPEPEMLTEILEDVGSPKLGICLDVGHANAYSSVSVDRWLEICAPYIRHFHIHNNDGSADQHHPLDRGSIDMKTFLSRAGSLCPDASFTLEVQEAASSLRWLEENAIGEESQWKMN